MKTAFTEKMKARIAKKEDLYETGEYYDSQYLFFSNWQGYGKHRIYINDYKGRKVGFIDCKTGEIIINDYQGNSREEVDTAIKKFNDQYTYIDR